MSTLEDLHAFLSEHGPHTLTELAKSFDLNPSNLKRTLSSPKNFIIRQTPDKLYHAIDWDWFTPPVAEKLQLWQKDPISHLRDITDFETELIEDQERLTVIMRMIHALKQEATKLLRLTD